MRAPPSLVAMMTGIHGARGTEWCASLPDLVAARARRWGLELGHPFPADYHLVVPARRGAEEVVLKLGIPTAEREMHREAAVLRVWDGAGSVRLLDADLDAADAVALLLERIRPGTDLVGTADDEALPLLGRTAAALHAAGDRRPPEAVDAADLADLRAGHLDLPRAVTARAADLLDWLLESSAERVLCHGDLHHGNLLRGSERTVAIDPRGVWAEPAHDVGVALLNPLGTLPRDRRALPALLERRLESICPAMGVDIDRGRAWTVVAAVVSALWTAQDGLGVEEDSLAVAAVLAR